MSRILASNFASGDFNPEKFIKDLSSECIGAEELRHRRANIQELSGSTSAMLKRNVYQNYIQFIETAKEISHLESEMYQLSQSLYEQRSLLSALAANQIAAVEFEENLAVGLTSNFDDYSLKEEEPKQKLIKLLESIDGAMNLIDVSGRVCLHEGTLLELDPVEGTPLKRIHAYLFNDILMIASCLTQSNKIGLSRYKIQAVYDLKSLAVINIRDLGNVKLAFKLLAFPDTRVFQCASAISKKEWLDKCDQAKKLKASHAAVSNVDNTEKSTDVQQLFPTSRSVSSDSNTIDAKTEAEYCHSLPEWILEVTEDLDSCIAQRHFEEAFNLLDRTKNYIQDLQNSSLLYNLKAKINERSNSLINVLRKELEMSAEAKSLQGGGLRSAKRAVKLLIRLDRCAHACQLYLRLCGAALKARLKRVKREGPTLPYIKQMSAIVFSNVFEMSQEFLKIFSPHVTCNSALLVWCSHELKLFTSHVIKQMFIPQVPLTTLAECIMIIRDHCEQLTSIGIDFRYQLDGQIRVPLIRALRDTKEKYIDAIKVRSIEDGWRPSNLNTTQQLEKLRSELDDLGIPLPQYYLRNESSLPLTNNTLTFSKLYVGLLEDCLNVTTPEIINIVEDVLGSILQVQVQHALTSLTNLKFQQEKKLIHDNIRYIHDIIITRTLELYKSVTGQDFKKLIALQEQLYSDPVSSISKPKPVPRTSIPKYFATEYI